MIVDSPMPAPVALRIASWFLLGMGVLFIVGTVWALAAWFGKMSGWSWGIYWGVCLAFSACFFLFFHYVPRGRMICWTQLLCLATALANNPFVPGPFPRINGALDLVFLIVLLAVIALLAWGYIEVYGWRGAVSLCLLAAFAYGLWSLDPANTGTSLPWGGGFALLTLGLYWYVHPGNTFRFCPPKRAKVAPQA